MKFVKFILGCLAALPASAAASSSAASSPARALFEARCLECHDAAVKKGGLNLSALPDDLSDPAVFARWLKIHDYLASGQMPPPKKPRPDPAELKPALEFIAQELTAAEQARRGKAGRATWRRLTRSEYEHTLQDIFSFPGMPMRDELPADGNVGGFNKLSGALDISYVHMAKYMEVARKVLDRATATRLSAPIPFRTRCYPAAESTGFVDGLLEGDCVLLKNKKRDPVFPLLDKIHADKERVHYYIDTIFEPCNDAVGFFRQTEVGFGPRFEGSVQFSRAATRCDSPSGASSGTRGRSSLLKRHKS